MTFPERLSELIGPSRGSQSRLSEAIGVTKSMVTDWTKGRKKPSMDNIIAMADYFSVTTDYLLCITNANKSPTLEISENGRKMLSYFEDLSKDDQILLIGEAIGLYTAANRANPDVGKGEKHKAG